jgi:transcriptional regulator with XRE-family HTH domain
MTASRKVTNHAISPAQCRAARGLLDWSRDQLAEESRTAVRTILRFEAGEGETRATTLAAISTAFEAAGVQFTNGDEPGVKLVRLQDG